MSSSNALFFRALARAYGGALIFAMPLLMTMEMWQLGFYMPRARLIILIVLTLPLLVALSYYSGFEETFSLEEDLVDASVAIAVGASASAAILALFGVIARGMSSEEIVGKIVLTTVPASIGALLAQSQLAQEREQNARRRIGYWGGVFLMGVGALFLAWNVAPTEEIVLIAMTITPIHGLLITLLSIAIVHAFMFGLEFRGQPDIPPDTPFHHLFLRETSVGYAISLLISAYVLWSFGRFEGLALLPALLCTIVLALPAALGAAAARLIL